jgi:hypothetical protein
VCHRPTSEDVVDDAGENPDRWLVMGPDRAATSSIYDRRRQNFDRHAAYVVVAFVAGG